MNPTLAKTIAAAIVSVLSLLGTVGVPGIGNLDLGEVQKTAALVIGAVIGGAMFVRQHWLIGKQASTQPVKPIDFRKADIKSVK